MPERQFHIGQADNIHGGTHESARDFPICPRVRSADCLMNADAIMATSRAPRFQVLPQNRFGPTLDQQNDLSLWNI